MKQLTIAVTALMFSSAVAWAACPPGTRYLCVPSFGGKQSCGCR